MWEELTYQIVNTSAVNQAVFCFVYIKEIVSASGSEQRRDALSWI